MQKYTHQHFHLLLKTDCGMLNNNVACFSEFPSKYDL